MRLLPIHKHSGRFHDFDEYERLVTAAKATDSRAYVSVLLGGDAGLRCGEMMALEWTDVDLTKRQLCVQRSDWKAGLHAFRHSRVTQLRKAGAPQDLQKQWIGHSSLRTGDWYRHTHEEVEYRRSAAGNAGLDRVLRSKQSQREAPTGQSGLVLKPTV